MNAASVVLRPARQDEAARIAEMEREANTAGFITPASAEDHQEAMTRSGLHYLAVEIEGRMVGYILLAEDETPGSIELRRIVIQEKGQGFGQQAMLA